MHTDHLPGKAPRDSEASQGGSMGKTPSGLHPEGHHPATVEDYGLGAGYNDQSCHFFLRLKTKHGVLNTRFYFTPNAARYTAERISNLGFKGDDFGTLNTDRSLIGNACVVIVQHKRDRSDQLYADVITVLSPDKAKGGAIPANPDAVEMARKFNYLLKPGAATPSPQKTPPPTQQGSDEDFSTEDGERF